MEFVRRAAVLVFLAIYMAACSGESAQTEITAVVVNSFDSHEGLETGDPLAGGELRVYVDDTVVLETILDDSGTAVIAPEPGTYYVQVSLNSSEPGCFWGETIFGIEFPSAPLILEAAYICAGQ